MVRIKICGMTRSEDVKEAVALGTDALGFILADSSRRISLDRAAELVEGLPPFVSRVAVVADPEEKELDAIVASGLFDCIQFHGKEDPSIFEEIPLRTIKALGVASEDDLELISSYRGADFFLFDARVGRNCGGTGRTFDWSFLRGLTSGKSFILAGGLGPENVGEAVREVRPAAVDLNSRLETEPGKKNARLMRQAVTRIREAEIEIMRSEMR